MLDQTGCDAVMVGRGALGNPWLLAAIIDHLAGRPYCPPSLVEREQAIRRHLELAIDYYGEVVGTRDFRKHLLWYTKGLRGGAQFREVAGRITDRTSVWRALEDLFRALTDTLSS
jgi:tRNA-dihydrouridine synthase B